jgi:hypothetical protein
VTARASRALPLTEEQQRAIDLARGRGGKLVHGEQTLDLWGPPDYQQDKDGLATLVGTGTIKALLRRGALRWSAPDEVSVVKP